MMCPILGRSGLVSHAGGAVSVIGTSELFNTREREILKLLGQGKTSKEIAVLLTLRISTIASHRRSICRKLDVHSTAALIQYAVARLASRSGIEIETQ
jgi:DNA-binding CsgD family transcriptional regulator